MQASARHSSGSRQVREAARHTKPRTTVDSADRRVRREANFDSEQSRLRLVLAVLHRRAVEERPETLARKRIRFALGIRTWGFARSLTR
jgi:hypothetical protein